MDSKKQKTPKLRNVDKVKPPYPINKFPDDFALKLGREIVYILATRPTYDLEGKDWELIFAKCINADWKPSNVGLDDIVTDTCAWGAKTAKSNKPYNVKRQRLISGRNSPVYSYGASVSTSVKPDVVGRDILGIWNERVASIRSKYKHVRTVVLLKSPDLCELSVFEFETIMYEEDLYKWVWNKRGNLEGRSKQDGKHRFTWQPHGSQFTIIEDLPKERLDIKIKKPEHVSKEGVLIDIGFEPSWVEIIK